jgi:hypothetical protein
MSLFGESAPEPGIVRSYDARRSRQEFEQFNTPTSRPKTATELAADRWLAWETEQNQKREAEEKRKLDEQRRRQAAAQQEADRRAKLAQAQLADDLEEDLRERVGFPKATQTWDLNGGRR